jgi:NADH-quinone oxidoreductase subunit C
MKSAEEILARIQEALPGAGVKLVLNPSVSAQHSLLLAHKDAVAVAAFLREDDELALDYCSNATGIDWPDKEITGKVKVTKVVDGVETQVDETIKRIEPGYLETVYHLFSMRRGPREGGGPVVLRMRTADRKSEVSMPSLTPVWRSCEFQEREIFDLFGIVFTGHPDLRRILMWDEFEDHPMRRDYVDPDDYEYEPTPHDEVLKRAEAQKAEVAS